MDILIVSILIVVIICLWALRYHIIVKAAEDWNYKVYRFERYCTLHDIYNIEPEANRFNATQILLVCFMFWKINPRYFFDNCPDWADIDELIQTQQI